MSAEHYERIIARWQVAGDLASVLAIIVHSTLSNLRAEACFQHQAHSWTTSLLRTAMNVFVSINVCLCAHISA